MIVKLFSFLFCVCSLRDKTRPKFTRATRRRFCHHILNDPSFLFPPAGEGVENDLIFDDGDSDDEGDDESDDESDDECEAGAGLSSSGGPRASASGAGADVTAASQVIYTEVLFNISLRACFVPMNFDVVYLS